MSKLHNNAGTIKFCATGKSGLGHLRRVCNIATQAKALSPRTELVLLTNAPVAGLSDEEAALFSRIHVCPRERMAGVLAEEAPGPVVIDTAVIPHIEAVEGPLCLILRETVSEKLGSFKLGYGRQWDALIVPSPKEHWSVDPAALGAKVVHYAGWIYRPPLASARVLPKAEIATLLIATGGGGNRETAAELSREIDGILSQLRQMTDVRVLHAAGPRLPVEGRLAQADAQIDVASKLNIAFAEADAVVSTVGYNSVLELAAVTTPSLLVPISRTFDDQAARAVRWGRSLGRAHGPGSGRASAQWLASVLTSRARRPAIDLGSGADRRAAEIILGLSSVPGKGTFFKAAPNFPRAQTCAALANALRGAGAPVLPTLLDSKRSQITMPLLDGRDGRDMCRSEAQQGAKATLRGCVAKLAEFHEAGVRVDPSSLSLFDPFSKIRPRIGNCPDPQLSSIAAKLSAQIEEALAFWDLDDAYTTLVHGDFHAGQVIFCRDGGECHIVDLDDVAIGMRESDLGNLIAHASTCAQITNGPIFGAAAEMLADFVGAYNRASHKPLDHRLTSLYCAASLLRRALKLIEREEPRPRIEEILRAAGSIVTQTEILGHSLERSTSSSSHRGVAAQ